MPDAPCGSRDCPVVEPGTIDRRLLRVHTLPSGSEQFRVAPLRFDPSAFTPAGTGNGRFSPFTDRRHTYVADQRSAAVLETVLHEAAGPNPRIYATSLANHGLHRIRFTAPVRLIDLRDPALADLGLEREQLTGSTARHYACTRAVAERIVGTKRTSGFVWTSRQGALHAERNRDGLASEVLRHQNLDVAVIYQPPFDGGIDLVDSDLPGSEALLQGGEPTRFVVELANLLRIAIL